MELSLLVVLSYKLNSLTSFYIHSFLVYAFGVLVISLIIEFMVHFYGTRLYMVGLGTLQEFFERLSFLKGSRVIVALIVNLCSA